MLHRAESLSAKKQHKHIKSGKLRMLRWMCSNTQIDSVYCIIRVLSWKMLSLRPFEETKRKDDLSVLAIGVGVVEVKKKMI